MANGSNVYGWGAVVAAMIGIGLVVGLAVGGLGVLGILPSAATPAIIGVICGFATPILILRLRTQR